MNKQDFLDTVRGGLGTFGVTWESTVTPAARWKGHTLVKRSTAIVMTGATFAGLAENADRETGPLPWGEWSEHPYVITHKGQDYFRLNVVDGTIRTLYSVDGIDVEREMFLSYLTPSAREAKRPIGGTITVKAAGLHLIGNPALATR
jgi:hypothetical protein